MQLFGILSALGVIVIGFVDRSREMGAFDPVALFIIILGMAGAIILSSRPRDTLQTLKSVLEIIPFVAKYGKESDSMEVQRKEIEDLWVDGKKTEALAVAEQSTYTPVKIMMDHILSRSDDARLDNRFTALGHECVDKWEPTLGNWELMAKLGPAFGMVGTLTGMIKLFKDFGASDANLGANLSLALLSTLYGLVLGAGIAGPIGHYISTIMNQRVMVLKRCYKTAKQLIKMG